MQMNKESVLIRLRVSVNHLTERLFSTIDLISTTKFITLLGPSGCGKTTTLKLSAVLRRPIRAKFLKVTDKRPTAISTSGQHGFQRYALFHTSMSETSPSACA